MSKATQQTNTNHASIKLVKQLISEVQKEKALYDPKHESFSNITYRDEVWTQIADSLNVDVESCKTIWIKLRYHYQEYVRKLQKFFQRGPNICEKRPVMAFETELLFLWEYIQKRKPDIHSVCKDKSITESDQQISNLDDDIILVEKPVEVVVIDDEDQIEFEQFIVTDVMRALVDLVKRNPSLYDHNCSSYRDHKLKANIWYSICNIMKVQVEYLLKLWTLLQTRYEWERKYKLWPVNLNRQRKITELQCLMSFMEHHTLKKKQSIYQQSEYLKHNWCNPMLQWYEELELFKCMQNLPRIVSLTENCLTRQEKPSYYNTLWSKISKLYNCDFEAGQCEVFWLFLRQTYWDLRRMQSFGYFLKNQFADNINNLYIKCKNFTYIHESQISGKRRKLEPKVSQEQHNINTVTELKNINILVQNQSIENVNEEPKTCDHIVLNEENNSDNNNKDNRNGNQCHLSNQSKINNDFDRIMIENCNEEPEACGQIVVYEENIVSPSLDESIKDNEHEKQYQLNNQSKINKDLHGITVENINEEPETCQFVVYGKNMVTPSLDESIKDNVNENQYYLNNEVKINNDLHRITIENVNEESETYGQFVVYEENVVTPSLDESIKDNVNKNQSKINNDLPGITIENVNEELETCEQILVNEENMVAPSQEETIKDHLINQNKINKDPHIVSLQTIPKKVLQETNNVENMVLLINKNKEPLQEKEFSNQSQNAVTNDISNSVSNEVSTNVNDQNSINKKPTTIVTVGNITKTLTPYQIKARLIQNNALYKVILHDLANDKTYVLNSRVSTEFIRDVLALPVLYSQRIHDSSLQKQCWNYIRLKYNLPHRECLAYWNFLTRNLLRLKRFLNMEELMRPYMISKGIWTFSHKLFQNFHKQMCDIECFDTERLVKLIDYISAYYILYMDVDSNAKVTKEYIKETNEFKDAWREVNSQFTDIKNCYTIWEILKSTFIQYMEDIECSIINPWPMKWWRVLSKMEFLVSIRYKHRIPLYLLISSKIVAEIQRCSRSPIKTMCKTLTNDDTANNMKDIDNSSGNQQTTNNDSSHNPTEKENSALVVQNQGYFVEATALQSAIYKRPIIYAKDGNEKEKFIAWKEVANELNVDVETCLHEFKYLVSQYVSYRQADPNGECDLNQRYYSKLANLFNSLNTEKKTETVMPTNTQSLDNNDNPYVISELTKKGLKSIGFTTDPVLPSKFISDINMTNSPTNLVVKNWFQALGSLPQNIVKNEDILKEFQAMFNESM